MSDPAWVVEDELPQTSAELSYLRVQTEALIVVLGPKKGAELVRVMANAFADEQRIADVLPIRSAARQSDVRAKRRQAAAIFEAWAPLFVARVPRK